jgi:translation initiation factor 6
MVERVLGVEVFPMTIMGNPLVGSYAVMTNMGALVHPLLPVDELEELAALVQAQVVPTTVCKGSESLGAGVAANDTHALVGVDTTAQELRAIESALQLTTPDSDSDEDGIRADLLSRL